jgi:hypothetical protein
MVYWLTGAVAPRAPRTVRAAVALGVAWAVEFGQLLRAPWLVALRATTLGHLALGTDFDARDLGEYAVGVGAAALADWAARRVRTAQRSRPARIDRAGRNDRTGESARTGQIDRTS